MKNESKGLGDTVAKITKATGIDKLVKFVAGEDCGCDERKEKQNSLIAINNRVLNQNLTFSTCSSCLRDLVSKLRIIHAEYTPEQTEEITTEENAVD